MPKYSKSNIRYTIREDEFQRIIKSTKLLRDRLFLCLLYCTGARPSEIAGDPARGLKGMTVGDVVYDLGKGEITFRVPISKLKKDEYGQEKRILTLEFNPNNIDLPIRIIINWLNKKYKYFQKTGEVKQD
jgi:site-specific recombinase XerD